MLNTHSVIFWKDKNGSTVVSQRYATSYSEPQVIHEPPSVATVIEVKVCIELFGTCDWLPIYLLTYEFKPVHASATTFVFQIPANSTLISSSDKHYIVAFSIYPPEGQDPTAHLSPHRQVGSVTLDVTKDFVAPSSSSSPSNTPKTKTKPNKQEAIAQAPTCPTREWRNSSSCTVSPPRLASSCSSPLGLSLQGIRGRSRWVGSSIIGRPTSWSQDPSSRSALLSDLPSCSRKSHTGSTLRTHTRSNSLFLSPRLCVPFTNTAVSIIRYTVSFSWFSTSPKWF